MERVEPADAAQEAIVARAVGVVTSEECLSVEVDDRSVAEAKLEGPHGVALRPHHRLREHGVHLARQRVKALEVGQSAWLRVEKLPVASVEQ
jgi:hypothetical protein